MSRATRREKLEAKLSRLESEFCELLVEALKRCAAGEGDIFGQNDAALRAYSPQCYERLKSQAAESLLQLGQEITDVRETLDIKESFKPLEAYLGYRQRKLSNDLGATRLAAQFLAELKLLGVA